MKKKIYTATDIEWETDGEEIDLPNEVILPDGICSCQCKDAPECDCNYESINNYLSDKYGWLVKNYYLI